MEDRQHFDDKVHDHAQEVAGMVRQEVVRSREPWYRVTYKTQILIAIYLILLVVFAFLAVVVHIHPILPVDIFITREFQENQSPWLHIFMIAVSFLGNQALIFSALILFTAIVFWLLRLHLEALFIIGLSVVSFLLNILLKYIVSRPRPTSNLVDVIQKASGHSFPSGHVMSYMAFWGLLFSLGIILFRRDHWWNYMLLIVPAFFVITVGPSRIYLGDHWASDVLGAYLIGSLLLGLALWLYLVLKGRGILAPPLSDAGD